jgi:hypothetical protein
MKPVPFNPSTDLATTPFTRSHVELAREMKRLGLDWQPHVGCFVWDSDGRIAVDSPFPERIYFILSLPRFIDMFGSREAVAEALVWLPTWHQARLLCRRYDVADERVAAIWAGNPAIDPGRELIDLYGLLIEALKERKPRV